MKKFTGFLLCILILFFGMVLTGCELGDGFRFDNLFPGDDDDDNGSTSNTIEVEFLDLTANGSPLNATTTLVLTFSRDIAGLEASDIAFFSGNTGANRGDLTRTGTGIYNLTVSGIVLSGPITIRVNKSGYTINTDSRSIVIYQQPVTINFNSVTADGSFGTTTTTITLNFSHNITGFNTADIRFEPATAAIRGMLERTGTGVYRLSVSGIEASGLIEVIISKTGFIFTPPDRKVQIFR